MEQKNLKEKNNEVIKKLFPPKATEDEIRYCLAVAEKYNLSPIKREIFFIERKQKVNNEWVTKIEPLIGRDGFSSIAHQTGQFAGMETILEIKEIPKLENGEWVYKKDLIARCTVYRKDSNKPFITEVAYSEYVQKTSDGYPTKFWATKPKTMLGKVAESQCLRKAFNISGIYSAEEVGYGTYSDDGNILKDEPEPETEIKKSRKEEIEEILKKSGINYDEKDGWLGVKNYFKHKNLLENLGFRLVKNTYVLNTNLI